MIESVHCPQCQTAYGLRPSRIRYGLRRAKCFRCGDIFPIENEVTRLLSAGLPQESPAHAPTPAPVPGLPPVEAFAGVAEISGDDFSQDSVDTWKLPASELARAYERVPEELAPAPAFEPLGLEDLSLSSLPEEAGTTPDVMPDSLTLGDLEGTEAEILDKTLVDYQAPPSPAPPYVPVEEVPSAAVTTAGGGSFSSAKDAIAKILGGMESPAKAPTHSGPTPSNPMDMEATLSALDETLGGTRRIPLPETDFLSDLQPLPEPAAAPAFSLPEIELPPLPTPEPEMPSPATVRLTREQMMAALQAPPEPAAASTQDFFRPAPASLEPPPVLESTLIMNVPAFAPPPAPPRTGATTSFMPVVEGGDQNLFKVQLGTDTLSDLSMDNLTAMVRDGRLADYHMVARQFSENWIEAAKVPALRPLFERQRREQGGAPEAPAPEAPKKSLFGGLFGRKDG